MAIHRPKINEITDVKRLEKPGVDYLKRVRGKERPSRNVGGGLFNVVVSYPSAKMGYTRDAESRTLEFAYLLLCEFSNAVIEYYTQPDAIKLVLENASGKKSSYLYTADFLVIYKDIVVLVECKPEHEILKQQTKNPNKYTKNTEGKWVYLPASSAAEEMGFSHIVITEKDINNKLTRNIQFMLGEINQLHNSKCSEDFATIKSHISEKQSILLSDLKKSFSQREIFQAIVTGAITADLLDSLLKYPETMWIYSNTDALNKHKLLKINHALVRVCDTQSLIDSRHFIWDDEEWKIVGHSRGKNGYINITDGEDVITISLNKIPKFISNNNIFIKNTEDFNDNLISKYTEHEISVALYRFNIIQNVYSAGKERAKTIRTWKKSYKDAEAKWGNGFLGLIPNTKKKGNRTSRLPEETEELLQYTIKNTFLRPIQTTTAYAHQVFVQACEEKSIPSCSYPTFCKRTSNINVFTATRLREGHKSAHQLGPMPRNIDLKNGLPAHGEFSFSVAHIDHTLIEMNFVSSIDRKPIGLRMWITLMIDSCTKCVLGMYLCFRPPSYVSVMMVLRDCVRRFNRLPLNIVTDQGAEFFSEDYDSLLASCFITKNLRPKGHPRFGSVIETFFNTIQKGVIINEPGNRRNKALGRSSSSSHDPEKFACITPSEFSDMLEKWIFNDYINKPHSGLFSTPAEALVNFSKDFDDNKPGIKDFNRSLFWILSLPLVDSKMLTINKGMIYVKKIPYVLGNYIHGVSGNNKHKVPVKYDPLDLSKIYARINGKWEMLKTSDHRIRQCADSGIKMMHLEIFPKAKSYNMDYAKGLSSNNPIFTSAMLSEKNKEFVDFMLKNENGTIFSNVVENDISDTDSELFYGIDSEEKEGKNHKFPIFYLGGSKI